MEQENGKVQRLRVQETTRVRYENTFEGANQAIPMKTLVIYCFDPRAADIPQAVATYLGDEVYPGENILDEAGNRVGSNQGIPVYRDQRGWTRRLRSRVGGGHGLYF